MDIETKYELAGANYPFATSLAADRLEDGIKVSVQGLFWLEQALKPPFNAHTG